MKREYRYHLFVTRKQFSEKIGNRTDSMSAAKKEVKENYASVKLSDEEHSRKFREVLEKESIEFIYLEKLLWSKEETEQSKWVTIEFVGNPLMVDSGTSYGNPIDLSDACEACGAGLRHKDHIRINGPIKKVKSHMFELLSGEIIVSAELKREMISKGICGCEFLPVISAKTGVNYKGYWCINVLATAPRFHKDSWYYLEKKEKCSKCRRSGWVSQESREGLVVYNRDDLNDSVDTYLSWEYFGSSEFYYDNLEESTCGVGGRLFIVSNRIFKIIKKYTIRKTEYWPIKGPGDV